MAFLVAALVVVALVAFNMMRNRSARTGYADAQAALTDKLAAQPDLSAWSDSEIVDGHFTDLLQPQLKAEYERRGLTP